jgi:hypothetical protein
VHLAALAEALAEASSQDRRRSTADDVREPLSRARKHAERIVDLLEDHDVTIPDFDWAIRLLDGSYSPHPYEYDARHGLQHFADVVSRGLAEVESSSHRPFGAH